MKIGIIGKGKMGSQIKSFFEKENEIVFSTRKLEKLQELKKCDFVFESTIENYKIKKEIHKKIKCYSNTSSFSKFKCVHFMNPIEKIKIIEVTKNVDKKVIDFLELNDFKIFVVPNIKGLIINRVLFGGLSEYIKLKNKYKKININELTKEVLRYDYDKIINLIGESLCLKIVKNLKRS